jgi:hypothetical protein
VLAADITLHHHQRGSNISVMPDLPRARTAWILGIFLLCIGALFHSYGVAWATAEITTPLSSTGNMPVPDFPLEHLFEDTGIGMMAFGGIAFTLGLVAWIYPVRR